MDHVLKMMARKHIPLTRENYIFFAFMGEKEYQELEGEELAMLPDIWTEDGELIQWPAHCHELWVNLSAVCALRVNCSS
jgi:hypothetical protein